MWACRNSGVDVGNECRESATVGHCRNSNGCVYDGVKTGGTNEDFWRVW